ncbi:Unknown protein sequence [Pseudomonas syringae pv. maculicola]|nr:Unknown protein sequence [Pseudomonas syringae pv. maculicola]
MRKGRCPAEHWLNDMHKKARRAGLFAERLQDYRVLVSRGS